MPTELVHIDQALHELSGGLAGCHASSWSPPPELGAGQDREGKRAGTDLQPGRVLQGTGNSNTLNIWLSEG